MDLDPQSLIGLTILVAALLSSSKWGPHAWCCSLVAVNGVGGLPFREAPFSDRDVMVPCANNTGLAHAASAVR